MLASVILSITVLISTQDRRVPRNLKIDRRVPRNLKIDRRVPRNLKIDRRVPRNLKIQTKFHLSLMRGTSAKKKSLSVNAFTDGVHGVGTD